MKNLISGQAWEPPGLEQLSWEDFLIEFGGGQVSEGGDGAGVQILDGGEFLLESADVTKLGAGSDSGAWLASAAVDQFLDGDDDLGGGATFFVDENVSLPGLSSEVSSLAGRDASVRQDSVESCDKSQDGVVCSPESCSSVEPERAPSSNSGHEGHEAGNVTSRSHSPVQTSCLDRGAASPDGSDSSDVGAMGRSCDNFCEQSDEFGDKASGELDEDAKRQSRLMRNRESATQSRQRKKAYVKEMEAKCRAMETQMSMLHQTVAFTSAQNAALREELAHYRCPKGSGSKSGAMEPAALPSDSLPSESPSRRTSPCLSGKLELVAFLCHVWLLTMLQAAVLEPARRGERTPIEGRGERLELRVAACPIERFSRSAPQLRKRQCSSNRGRRRFVLLRDDDSLCSWESVLSSAPSKRVDGHERISTNCKTSGKKSLKRLLKRSQYRHTS